jgi:hypothetical protein
MPSPPRRAAGDLRAIGALLKVLDSIDRYRKAGARKAVYDAAARKRLFAKLNRIAAQFKASEAPAAAAAPASTEHANPAKANSSKE